MRSAEDKQRFIQLRAEGKSYAAIKEELGLAKSTCSEWERELKTEIAQLKSEQLSELYDSYHMTKEARIKKLGDTLASIEKALGNADLASMPPEKLLDFKLKYTEALKGEYMPPSIAKPIKNNFEAKDIMAAVADLLNRVRSGEVTAEQASRESLILSNLLKAYDAVELKTKLDALESLVNGR